MMYHMLLDSLCQLRSLDQAQKQLLSTISDTQANAAWILHPYMTAVTVVVAYGPAFLSASNLHRMFHDGYS